MIRSSSTRVGQPTGPVEIDWANPLAEGLQLDITPSAGLGNLARRGDLLNSRSNTYSVSQTGIFSAGGETEYAATVSITNSITLFTIMRARSGGYLYADGARTILSSRNASNQGWTWDRSAAVTGGAFGTVIGQRFTLQGISAYAEANPLIPSDLDTPVAVRYNKATGVISWFANGVKSSADTSASTGGFTGGGLVYRQQGPFSGSSGRYLDLLSCTKAWQRLLSDDEIASISENPWQLYRPAERRIWVGAAGGGPVTLVTSDAAHAQTASSLTLATTTATSLTIAASAHAQTADALTLTAATALTVASAAHAQTAESLTLTAATGLSLADAAHAQTADPLTLTTASALALDNAAHAQAADNLALSTTGAASLTVASASHAQAADALALTSATAITVNSAAHAQAADSITLASVESLVVASASHAQAVDNVLLVIGGIGLAVDSAAHAQTAENIAPSTDSFLVVADASHGQTADLLTLSTASFFAVDGATHAQTADNLSLDGVPTLQVGSALHAQAADALALTSDSWLAVADALHAQRADNLTLVAVGDVVYTRAPAGGGFSRAPLATARDPRQTAGRSPRR